MPGGGAPSTSKCVSVFIHWVNVFSPQVANRITETITEPWHKRYEFACLFDVAHRRPTGQNVPLSVSLALLCQHRNVHRLVARKDPQN